MTQISAYLLVESNDAKENPEVDKHADEYVCFHLLNADQVMKKLNQGRELQPHKDALHIRVLIPVEGGAEALLEDRVLLVVEF